jgi:DNA-binding GntR family transcriptional regulator
MGLEIKAKKEDSAIIDHGTLADRAFDYLSKAILAGELSTEDRLVESELSEKLGISRAPLREALAELERQGLAYSVVRRGTFVTPWTKQDLWEVAILRSTLEALVSELAVSHISEEDIAFLEQVIVEMAEADRENDTDRLIDLDFDFHDRILERCNHKRLQRVVNGMRLQVKIFRLMTKQTDFVPYPVQHHTLLDALKTGDPHVARENTYSHVMESAELALAALPDEGAISVPAGP